MGDEMEVAISKHLKVGDLAKLSGKSVRALRLYEELDLLHPVGRSSGGFRQYDESAITRIRWIELLQGAGLSLHQIQELLKAWHRTKYGPEAMATVRAIFEKKLEETRRAIVRSQTLAQELEGTIEYLQTCQGCGPARTTHQDCPQCPEDHGVKNPPALVAGFHTEQRGREGITLNLTGETR
jgi:DNA-binding transcriptional MerR regulator